MKKLLTFTFSMMVIFILFSGVASAHITIQPGETSQGKYEVFTVQVPSESDEVPTTKVEVVIPEEVRITRFEPKPGWTYEVRKDDKGKITSVTWTTEGDGLSQIEFIQFNMQGRVDDEATEIVWKTFQTYKDGSVVDWVGAPDSEKPASVTVVNPNIVPTSNNVPLYLSVVALIAGLLSLFISLKKRG